MADADFTLMGHGTRYGEWKEVKVKLTDNGDGTHSLAADPQTIAQLTVIANVLVEIRDLLSAPLDVSIV